MKIEEIDILIDDKLQIRPNYRRVEAVLFVFANINGRRPYPERPLSFTDRARYLSDLATLSERISASIALETGHIAAIAKPCPLTMCIIPNFPKAHIGPTLLSAREAYHA